jgi:transposase, IS30 family
MTGYRQLTSGERHALSALRKQRHCQAEIARALGRDRSTISREVRRNSRKDGGYRPDERSLSTPMRHSVFDN